MREMTQRAKRWQIAGIGLLVGGAWFALVLLGSAQSLTWLGTLVGSQSAAYSDGGDVNAMPNLWHQHS